MEADRPSSAVAGNGHGTAIAPVLLPHGPTILSMLTKGGRDLEWYVRGLFQTWRTKGQNASQHSAAEAVNLARMAHPYILEARFPRVALRSGLFMEILFRRLYALIMV